MAWWYKYLRADREEIDMGPFPDYETAQKAADDTEPHSYSELPLKYFEIVEDYRVDDGTVSNDVAVLLTVVSDTASGVEVIEVCRQIDLLESDHMKIVRPVDMICGKEEAIKFTASTNTKEDSYLTLAKVIFRWQE